MTTTNPSASSGITQQEFNSVRQNLKLLSAQIKSGHVDADFLSRLAQRLTDLMERFDEERQRARQGERFEALYNVSRILGGSLDLQVVLDQVMDAVLQLTGAERGFLMLRDTEEELNVQAARNLDQQTLDSSKFQYSRSIANEVLKTGEAVVTTNATEDPRWAGQASIMAQSLRSIMATPLRARGEVIGVAYVDSRVTTDLFDEADLNALEALAGQAAIAIENAKLFEQTDQQLAQTVEQLTELRRMDRQLNETLDPDKAMQMTLEWATQLSGAVKGSLGLLQGEMVPAVHHYGYNQSESAPDMLDMQYPRVQQVIQSSQPVSEIAAIHDTEYSVLIVPILRETRVLGVVVLLKVHNEPFDEEDIDIVTRVVSRASVTIENARLYAAVQAADRAKSEFVGIVAHDLKVPMTSILGYANLTKMLGEQHNNLIDRQAEFLDKISDTVRRMEVLVSDLADISRIESGHFFMDEIRVPVARIIEAVKDNTMLQIKDRGHQWVENIEPNLPDMYVDYYRLLQVLTNLTSNAYKYTPDGGTITFSAKRDGDRVRFTISDTGIGLSDAQVAMLGTKFWRAEDDYTRSQPGTGLGYAITSSLVQQMGSNIKIKSELGKGSAFSFSVAIANEKNGA